MSTFSCSLDFVVAGGMCARWRRQSVVLKRLASFRLLPEYSLVVGMKQCRPKVVTRSLPVHFSRAILQPVRQSHIAVCQVDGVGSTCFGCNRVLLGKNQPHDLTQLDVLEKERNVNRVGSIFSVWVALIFDEILFRDHLDVRVIGVDRDWTTQSDCDRSISSKQ